MKALQLTARNSVNFSAIVATVRNYLTARRLTRVALLCGIIVYVALMMGNDTAMYVAGISGILTLWLNDTLNPEGKKGGAR